MKYFLDTEFLEGSQKTWFGPSKPTIDLISIGIVAEDGRELYCISNEFNLKEAWNRYDIKRTKTGNNPYKDYWIRDNVLKNLFNDNWFNFYNEIDSLKELRNLVDYFGKSNKEIAEEVKNFIYVNEGNCCKDADKHLSTFKTDIEFYGYYADYDWVVFCWLFGKMIDLPKGFPMYCIDLKQELDEMAEPNGYFRKNIPYIDMGLIRERHELSKEEWLNAIPAHTDYPDQTNEHNALSDAKWNYELYKFIKNLK